MDLTNPRFDGQFLHAPVQDHGRRAVGVHLDLDFAPGESLSGDASECLDESFPGGESDSEVLRPVPLLLTVFDLGPGEDIVPEPTILLCEFPLHAVHVEDVATDSEDLGDRVPGLLGF